MLNIETFAPGDLESAAAVFHRDGLVVIRDALTPEQLAYARAGAQRVAAEQMAAIPLEHANRGYARYSYGPQLHHPEWAQLIAVPTILPVLDEIWGSEDYICGLGGGDYSAPGAEIQHLHADMRDVIADPLQQVTIFDVPTPFIVVNYVMTEFNQRTGATRFVPGTHRMRQRPPTLEEEPERMRQSFVCAPPGTAMVRDVRCWHGGTRNSGDQVRIMLGIGYYAPWFRQPSMRPALPRSLYRTLPERARRLSRFIVDDDAGGTASEPSGA